MTASIGNIKFSPEIRYIDSLPNEKYKACYIAIQTIKQLINKNMLKITTPQEVIDCIEAIMNE